MKIPLALTILAAAPALLLADPNPPAGVAPASPSSQEDLAEQAALVQQIGEDAARGFDAEAHARALRAQIEALIATPTTAKASASLETPKRSVPSPKPAEVLGTTAAPARAVAVRDVRDGALKESIRKLRSALEEFEAQLNVTGKDR